MIDLATNFNYKPTLISMEQRVCNHGHFQEWDAMRAHIQIYFWSKGPATKLYLLLLGRVHM